MLTKPTDTIASFAKGMQVITCFGRDTPRLSVVEVSQLTGLDRATARRCLLTLYAEGYAEYDGKFFTLTPQILRLGVSALASLPMPQLVQPWLDQISERIGQSCSVAILDETEIVYIARAALTRVMSVGLLPGSRLPAHCTSMGRVLLSQLAAEDAQQRVDASDLTPRTAFSLTSPDLIMERVAQTHEAGWCFVDQEVEIGLRSLAVPLFDSRGQPVAALNTGFAMSDQSKPDILRAYLPHLLAAQEGLARTLN